MAKSDIVRICPEERGRRCLCDHGRLTGVKGNKVQVREELSGAGDSLWCGLVELDLGVWFSSH